MSALLSDSTTVTSTEARFSAGATVGRIVDAVSDAAVIAFAVWTALAFAGMAFHLPVDPLLWLWAASLVPVGLATAAAYRRRAGGSRPSLSDIPNDGDEPRAALARTILAAAALVAGLVGAVLVTNVAGNAWFVGWAFGFAVIVAGLIAQLRWPTWITPRAVAYGADGTSTAMANVAALFISIGAAVVSLFVFRVDTDDAYYVNRASAVRDLGHIPVRDVLVSHEQFRPVGGTGAPVDTVGPLAGALARVFHA